VKNLPHCSFICHKSHIDSPGSESEPPRWKAGGRPLWHHLSVLLVPFCMYSDSKCLSLNSSTISLLSTGLYLRLQNTCKLHLTLRIVTRLPFTALSFYTNVKMIISQVCQFWELSTFNSQRRLDFRNHFKPASNWWRHGDSSLDVNVLEKHPSSGLKCCYPLTSLYGHRRRIIIIFLTAVKTWHIRAWNCF
jgi:hypothetical protein